MIDFQILIISEEASLLDALAQLDKSAQKVLFVTQGYKLCAALTDGDVRRWILSKGSLEAKVRDFANYSPKYLPVSDRNQAMTRMLEFHLEALPLVNDMMEIVDVELIYESDAEIPEPALNLPVVIMAGGLGTRLYPYTKILPKPLIPIGEIPIAEHIIKSFRKYGCREFLMIVNHKKNMIKAYFNEIEKDYIVEFVDEEKPLGTGGGLSLLKGKIRTPFILTNCDVLLKEDYEKMYRYHQEKGNVITMVCSLRDFVIPYGVVDMGQDGCIDALREKPHLSFFVNTGVYLVEPEVIEGLQHDHSISFPAIIENHMRLGDKVGIYPISEYAWMDMGQFDSMDDMIKRIEDK